MRGLFWKIFAVLWVAQCLLAFASSWLILRQRAPDGGASVRTLITGLRLEAEESLSAYQRDGCDALRTLSRDDEQISIMQHSKALCSFDGFSKAEFSSVLTQDISGGSARSRFVWRIRLLTSERANYEVLISVPRSPDSAAFRRDVRDFGFPQLPFVLILGAGSSALLVTLLTRPIALLRTGARAIAAGNLSTRIPAKLQGSLFSDDAFQDLIEDFNSMADHLQALVEAHRLLLRDVSHELRSPLTRLVVALELAKRDQTSRRHLDRIESEASRLNDLIAQLLTLSAMETGASTEKRIVSLKELLEAIVSDALYEAAEKDCTVELQVFGGVEVLGHRDLLHAAFENIIRNAIRYTRPSSAVSIRQMDSENSTSMVVIEVLDDGPGIAEADFDAIFKPFYRSEEARASHPVGAGVGLAIADRAVTLHGGRVVARNSPQGGAIVEVHLPVEPTRARNPI